MTCDRAGERTLLLSLGLFGAPAGPVERDREAPVIDERERSDREDGDRTR
jgi:hypothetical protein